MVEPYEVRLLPGEWRRRLARTDPTVRDESQGSEAD